MFKDKNQFKAFVKQTDPIMAEQVFLETVSDVCLHGGNTLRNLLDSYSVFLKSEGDFNKNMRDFEHKLSEIVEPVYLKNLSVFESTNMSSFAEKANIDAVGDFSVFQHLREELGSEHLFNTIQDGIKKAQNWLN